MHLVPGSAESRIFIVPAVEARQTRSRVYLPLPIKQRPNINPPASLPPQHHHEVRRIQESLFSFFTPLRYPNLQFAKMVSVLPIPEAQIKQAV